MHFGKSGEAKARPKRTQSQNSAAHEGLVVQLEDGEAAQHRTLLYGNLGDTGNRATKGCAGQTGPEFKMNFIQ